MVVDHPSSILRRSKRESCLQFIYWETKEQRDELNLLILPDNHGQIRRVNTGFQNSRMRIFNNGLNAIVCLYIKVISYISYNFPEAWLSEFSDRGDDLYLSVLWTCLGNAEACISVLWCRPTEIEDYIKLSSIGCVCPLTESIGLRLLELRSLLPKGKESVFQVKAQPWKIDSAVPPPPATVRLLTG